MNLLEQLLKDRADDMAAHDGVPAGAVHLHGAANQLVVELQGLRDRFIHALQRGTAAPPAAEQPQVETPEPPESAAPADAEAPAEDIPAADGDGAEEISEAATDDGSPAAGDDAPEAGNDAPAAVDDAPASDADAPTAGPEGAAE